ncbi:MAG TPA: thioredoxin family protein [Gemmatimonadales bacterium]
MTCETDMTVTTPPDLRQAWEEALPYERFVAEADKNCGLWEGVYRVARIPPWAFQQACDQGRDVRLLVIAEDWCGDASNTVPILAKLGDVASCLEMRIVRRDQHPELMDHYLTNGARAIPIVIALDADSRELGHWGPRPADLQAWAIAHRDMPSAERYKQTRAWYAKDRGGSVLREVLALLQ